MKKTLFIFTMLACLCAEGLAGQEKREIFGSTLRIVESPEPGDLLSGQDSGKAELFNYNPVLGAKVQLKKRYNHILEKESSLFVVFQCAEKKDVPLISLSRGSHKVTITNQKIVSEESLTINKGNPFTGMVLGYFNVVNSVPSRKKGNLVFEDLLTAGEEGKTKLLELIYIPKMLEPLQRGIIESYLSIAYGISKEPGENYYDSEGRKLWEAKDNSNFSFRVTGVGRDDALGLYQKQSCNSENDGVSLAVGQLAASNYENTSSIGNKDYLIWSDNNGSVKLDQVQGQAVGMKRCWKISPGQQSFRTQLIVRQDKISLHSPSQPSQFAWLVIDTLGNTTPDYRHAIYKKGRYDGKAVIFDDVTWSRPATFTFINAPDFFVEKELEQPACGADGKGRLKLFFRGGNQPFKVLITGDNITRNLHFNEKNGTVEDLPAGSYVVESVDASGRRVQDQFTIAMSPATNVILADKWYLEDSDVSIFPIISSDEPVSCSWSFNNSIVSNERELNATLPGNYTLIVKDLSGCERDYHTTVLKANPLAKDNWQISPNPVLASTPFQIKFSLQEKSAVGISIIDINGRVIKSVNLGVISQYNYSDSLPTSGTYLIKVIRNGEPQYRKLIVN
ncbi:hypothetical protein FLLO111716_09885 [Flavobacterium longum]|uniref:T9SS type A sorting domain-containing protein n=1 Tax=Flavobacterium longum TaxID=1299340 RepID=UPI0039EB7415